MKAILAIDPIKYPLTGIGRYNFELASHLAEMKEIESLLFFRGTKVCSSLPTAAHKPSAMIGLRTRLLKSRLTVALYRTVAPQIKARALRGFQDYVFHGPNFYLPPFDGPSVVTMHDLSAYAWKDCHPPERVRYMQAEIELSLKRASILITDSEFIRQEMATHFGWPLEKIKAVPLASAEEFHPRGPEELQMLKNRYGLVPGEYCLFAGTIEPRKNIIALLDAYKMIPDTLRRRWPLVIAGYKGWNSDVIHARIAEAERAGWARYLGFVVAEDLPFIFSGARLFVFPSLYEGFGLPVLEAMASGVPVVCSNNSSLPEVVGDAAALCNAPDVEALKAMIECGFQDEVWRASAREKGLARAALFSWQRCAEETAAVYQAIQN